MAENKKHTFDDRMLSLGLARVSEAAAIASADWIGRGDEKAAHSVRAQAPKPAGSPLIGSCAGARPHA